VATVIEADLVATAVESLMDEIAKQKKRKSEPHELEATMLEDAEKGLNPPPGTRGRWHPGDGWEGTASELLGALVLVIPDNQAKLKEWPATPRALSSRLRRAAGTLRKVGIEVTFSRESGGSAGKRTRHIAIEVSEGNFASLPSLRSLASEDKDLERDAK